MPRSLAWPDWLRARTPVARRGLRRVVAFADCDAMGVVWHGNYLRYCELAREALGTALGFGTAEIAAAGWFAPVVRSQMLHRHHAGPGAELDLEAALYPTDQCRLYHRYRILAGPRLLCEAETEQVLTDRAFVLLLSQPPALARILQVGNTADP